MKKNNNYIRNETNERKINFIKTVTSQNGIPVNFKTIPYIVMWTKYFIEILTESNIKENGFNLRIQFFSVCIAYVSLH